MICEYATVLIQHPKLDDYLNQMDVDGWSIYSITPLLVRPTDRDHLAPSVYTHVVHQRPIPAERERQHLARYPQPATPDPVENAG